MCPTTVGSRDTDKTNTHHVRQSRTSHFEQIPLAASNDMNDHECHASDIFSHELLVLNLSVVIAESIANQRNMPSNFASRRVLVESCVAADVDETTWILLQFFVLIP